MVINTSPSITKSHCDPGGPSTGWYGRDSFGDIYATDFFFSMSFSFLAMGQSSEGRYEFDYSTIARGSTGE